MTFFTYRDVNLVYAYRPDDVEPQSLRKKVHGRAANPDPSPHPSPSPNPNPNPSPNPNPNPNP
jgi:hypothetical protein